MVRPKLNIDDLLDEDLQKARQRAERAINDEAFFDSRGGRIPKSTLNTNNLDDDIDEEVSNLDIILHFILIIIIII